MFVVSAVLMAFFSKNRYDASVKDPSNRIVYRYFLASFYVGLSLFVYGLSAYFTQDPYTLSFFVMAGMILNAIGFSHFFIIALYSWLSPKPYVFIKYGMFLLVAVMIICMIVNQPMPYIDSYNLFHFRFGTLVGILAAAQMDIIFIINVFIIMMHFYRLKHLSVLNSLTLVLTFIVAGISGSYLYIGDSTAGLFFASVGLYLGIAAVFLTIIHGAVNRMLGWQTRRE